jgi:hypothetical protein
VLSSHRREKRFSKLILDYRLSKGTARGTCRNQDLETRERRGFIKTFLLYKSGAEAAQSRSKILFDA